MTKHQYELAVSWIKRALKGHIQQIEVSGYLRRRKYANITNIKMVVSPKLLGSTDHRTRGFLTALYKLMDVDQTGKPIHLSGEPRKDRFVKFQTKRKFTLELCIVPVSQFGYWQFFHTGAKDFVHAVLKMTSGSGWEINEGQMRKKEIRKYAKFGHGLPIGTVLEFANEKDFFKFVKINYVNPWDRENDEPITSFRKKQKRRWYPTQRSAKSS